MKRKKGRLNEMDQLPNEILWMVSRYVDALTVPVLRCVCSLWRTLVQVPEANSVHRNALATHDRHVCTSRRA